jgi:hypothetical protein
MDTFAIIYDSTYISDGPPEPSSHEGVWQWQKWVVGITNIRFMKCLPMSALSLQIRLRSWRALKSRIPALEANNIFCFDPTND